MKGQLRLTNGRKLESPIGDSVRPTKAVVREAVMNIVRHKINNSNWLDLYSGSGIMGCEAIEKGAKVVVAIELNKRISKICKSNLTKIATFHKHIKFIDVKNIEANKFLRSGYKNYLLNIKNKTSTSELHFDLIYIDPPYKMNSYSSILDNLLDGDWVSSKCLAICEFSIKDGIDISKRWIVKDQKKYGNTGLVFLTPTQA